MATDPLRDGGLREVAPQAADPSVRAEASHSIDREVVLRQTFCPECLTHVQSDIVPSDEPSSRTRSIKATTA